MMRMMTTGSPANRSMIRSVMGLVVVLLMSCQAMEQPTEPIPAVTLAADADGYAIDRYVVDRLLNGTDRSTWVTQWINAPLPEDAVSLRVRLNLMVRDNQWAEARRTVRQLETLDPPNAVGSHDNVRQWKETAEFLIDWWQDPLARQILERRPDAAPHNTRFMLRRWQQQIGLAAVDAWLIDRQQTFRLQTAPPGKNNSSFSSPATGRPWLALRVELHRNTQPIEFLLAGLEQQARHRSADPEAQLDYLYAARYQTPRADIGWIVETRQAAGAYDAHRMGKLLTRWGWPAQGAILLERSLAAPFNDADETALRRMAHSTAIRKVVTPHDLERSLRRETRHALADAYVKSDQPGRAQPIVETLAAESGQALPLSLAQLAGRTQAGTGQRVIEKRVLDAEQESENQPTYWQNRARYFLGRGEFESADEAFRRAIDLAPFAPVVAADHDDPTIFARSQAIRHYAHFLDRQRRDDDLQKLIWREFGEVELTHPYARRMIKLMRERHAAALNLDEPRAWRWLDAQPTWESLEASVIRSMADDAGPKYKRQPDRRSELWDQAIPLTTDQHFSRAAALGSVMRSEGAPDRALPILEEALQYADKDAARGITANLFTAYLRIDDLQNVRRLWPQVHPRYTPREVLKILGRLVETAQRTNDPEALQHWQTLRDNLKAPPITP